MIVIIPPTLAFINMLETEPHEPTQEELEDLFRNEEEDNDSKTE